MRLEADDAMGVGINNAVLLLVAVTSFVVLGLAFLMRCNKNGRASP